VEAALWLQMEGFDRPGGCRMRGYSLSEADIEHIMQQEFTATCTDGDTVKLGEGVPHPRFYGTFARKLAYYALERRAISMAFAIRSMTSLPAQIIGLRDRGSLRIGAWADIVVFDPAAVRDRATFTAPHRYPDGIPFVLVNGVPVVDAGQLTRATPGRVLTPAVDGTRR
jgi:N-acyl-D-aspartate/D-glutamate deacylase